MVFAASSVTWPWRLSGGTGDPTRICLECGPVQYMRTHSSLGAASCRLVLVTGPPHHSPSGAFTVFVARRRCLNVTCTASGG